MCEAHEILGTWMYAIFFCIVGSRPQVWFLRNKTWNKWLVMTFWKVHDVLHGLLQRIFIDVGFFIQDRMHSNSTLFVLQVEESQTILMTLSSCTTFSTVLCGLIIVCTWSINICSQCAKSVKLYLWVQISHDLT